MIAPAINNKGNAPNSKSQINTHPEMVIARRTHTSTNDRRRLDSSLIGSFVESQ